MTRGRNGLETGTKSVNVMLMEKRVGVLTKKTPDAQRTRQMMMAGLLSAAEQQPLHLFGLLAEKIIFTMPSASKAQWRLNGFKLLILVRYSFELKMCRQ